MSFADLRANRKTKSYVQSSVTEPASNSSAINTSDASQGPEQKENVEPTEVASFPGLYQAIPPALEVRISEKSGRGLWTKAAIRAGTVILSLKPHVAALSLQHLDSCCSSCFASTSTTELRRCTKCRVVRYCDGTCQTNDWTMHKQECEALQRWFQAAPSSDVAPPSDAIRCLGRILWKKKKSGLDGVWSKEIDNMQSHRKSLQPSSFETNTHLAQALVQYMGLSSPADLAQFGLKSAADLVDLISRFTTNTFAITDPSLTPLGASVSPVVALINHSCDPNAVVVFPRVSADPETQEPLMQVVSLREISPGEEIFTSYIDITLPKASRLKTLQDAYYFACACNLCSATSEMELRESMYCPKSCGGLCSLPIEDHSLVRCVKCQAPVQSNDAIVDAVRVGCEGFEKAATLEFKDPPRAKQMTTNLIPILIRAGLTPSSHPLLGLTRLHQSLLISSFPSPLTQDHLDETIRTASKVVTGLTGLLRDGHPALAIAYTELGKLLAVDEPSPGHLTSQTDSEVEHSVSGAQSFASMALSSSFPPSGPARLKLAYEILLRARESLKIGFGRDNDGGAVGKEVRDFLASLEKEISVWKTGVKNALEDMPKTGHSGR
ncbi:SET domain-containing protein [Dendrothele bispora CBS 962.96]|uniref:SET domain-containing protein n=1 Tax=Dendrothele bispora (strain CBS 962.96) TaxID=1314807 RepID=A0A4S8M8T5_DENBC|nr:SET domain-containing protein [Dendrothele bispora CBS 962.96]